MSAESNCASLLAEAAGWRLVELLLERPRAGWHAEIRAVANETHDSRLEAAAAAAVEVDEGRYLAVFGPGGTVSPREVAYRPMGDPGRILTELRGIYEAFGFHPKSEDPPDHVAVQAGFAGFMKLKQAYARAAGDGEGEQTARAALERCLEDHLGGFVVELARKLKHSGLEHMARAGSVLADLCPDVPSSRVALPMAALPGDDQDGFVCGANCGD